MAAMKPDCCASMWKYCANSAECHSKCSDCCEVEAHTDKVDVVEEEIEVKVDGLFYAKKT